MIFSTAAKLISEVIAPVQLLDVLFVDRNMESCCACDGDADDDDGDADDEGC